MRKILATSILIFGLTGFGPASPAHAQDDAANVAEQVETLSQEGAEHFGAEEYERAIEKFEEAYDLQPVPNLLFNIGRCYEQLEEWERAEEYFREFIRSPDVDSESRDQAMERVDALREIQQAERDPDDEPDDAREDLEQQEQAVAETEADDDVEPPPEPNLVPGLATVGAGGALLLGGVFTGLAASGNADRISDTDLEYSERLDARDSARIQGVAADVMYVAGTAATAAGIYLLVTAGDRADTSRADNTGDDAADLEAVHPWFGRDSAGMGVRFGF